MKRLGETVRTDANAVNALHGEATAWTGREGHNGLFNACCSAFPFCGVGYEVNHTFCRTTILAGMLWFVDSHGRNRHTRPTFEVCRFRSAANPVLVSDPSYSSCRCISVESVSLSTAPFILRQQQVSTFGSGFGPALTDALRKGIHELTITGCGLVQFWLA